MQEIVFKKHIQMCIGYAKNIITLSIFILFFDGNYLIQFKKGKLAIRIIIGQILLIVILYNIIIWLNLEKIIAIW